MLISMPTDTSTIFGAFQAIWLSMLQPDELSALQLNYCGWKSSPLKFFATCPAQRHAALRQTELAQSQICARISRQKPVPSDLFPVVRHTVNGDVGLTNRAARSSEGPDDDSTASGDGSD
jgi:hypothetical protein